MVQEERLSLREEVEKLAKSLEEDKKVKKKREKKKLFKLPFKARQGAKAKLKKNYALVFSISTNKNINIHFLQIINDMVYLPNNQTYHLAEADYVMNYGKYPALIIPEWKLTPFSPKESVEKTEEHGEKALPQKVIINAMKMAQLKPTGKIGGRTMLMIIVGIVVVLYLISQLLGKT